ncbi:hypothetical protein [Burkholderia sp. Ac-20349]|uniref:hypothetical protein n=1 Tax=Burkholderia sp. Ac-20349 TaxID=2703893 RepID=UPI001F11B827|nr:hypothetical protein [Burkholderia sp. Ac-20349]
MTTEKSLADALTIVETERDGDWYEFAVNGHGGLIRVVARMEDDDHDYPLGKRVRDFLLAASPVEQHEAAPADERIEQLEASVKRYQNMVDVLKQRLHDAVQPEPPVADERAATPRIQRDTDTRIGLLFASKESADQWQARASSPNAAGAQIGWAWISPTGHVSRFTVEFDGKHDQLVAGWQVRPVAFCDGANAAGAEGTADLNERATLAAGQWANSNTPIKEALAYRDGFIAGAIAPAQAAEPVAWDFRMISGDVTADWHRCASKAHADELRKPDYAGAIEVRDLFAGPQPVAIPAGYALVPLVPTDEMLNATDLTHHLAEPAYTAMVAAAAPPLAPASAPVSLTNVQQAPAPSIEYSYASCPDAERWSGPFDSIPAAIAEALSNNSHGQVVYVGENAPVEINHASLAEEVVERIEEQVYEQVGELADTVGPFDESEMKPLTDSIKQWVEQTADITCWRVEKVKGYGPGALEYEAALDLLEGAKQ